MELASTVLPIVGIIGGVLVMIFGFRNKKPKPTVFGEIEGVLKQDWTRTGNVDFHAAALESTSPQMLVLRVEEQKIMENTMGQDIIQLRWRLATLDEAKEVVVHWNVGKSDRNPERRGPLLKSA
jgi:hypothetical protein